MYSTFSQTSRLSTYSSNQPSSITKGWAGRIPANLKYTHWVNEFSMDPLYRRNRAYTSRKWNKLRFLYPLTPLTVTGRKFISLQVNTKKRGWRSDGEDLLVHWRSNLTGSGVSRLLGTLDFNYVTTTPYLRPTYNPYFCQKLAWTNLYERCVKAQVGDLQNYTFFNTYTQANNLVLNIPNLFTSNRLRSVLHEWKSVPGPSCVFALQQGRTFLRPSKSFPWRMSLSVFPRINALHLSANSSTRYYFYYVLSRARGIFRNKKPVYSYFFKQRAIYRQYLLFINNRVPYWPFSRTLGVTKVESYFRTEGWTNSFLYRESDNVIEISVDSQLNQLTTTPFNSFVAELRTTTKWLGSYYFSVIEPPYNPIVTNLIPSGKINLPSHPLTGSNSWGGNSLEHLLPNSLCLKYFDSTTNIAYPLLLKFFFWTLFVKGSSGALTFKSIKFDQILKVKYLGYFGGRFANSLVVTNITPHTTFRHSIYRKFIKLTTDSKYLPQTTIFIYKNLIYFMEFFSGRKVYLKLNPFIETSLDLKDIARCYMWYGRVLGFQRILGHRIFVQESLKIFHLAIKYKDPTFLSNWIRAMLYRMSFWKYRVLLRYIKYVIRSLFWSSFEDLGFKGFKLTLRGKISVAGNARARAITYAIGNTSNSQMNNRVLSHFSTVQSFTGVMGFRVSFYF